ASRRRSTRSPRACGAVSREVACVPVVAAHPPLPGDAEPCPARRVSVPPELFDLRAAGARAARAVRGAVAHRAAPPSVSPVSSRRIGPGPAAAKGSRLMESDQQRRLFVAMAIMMPLAFLFSWYSGRTSVSQTTEMVADAGAVAATPSTPTEMKAQPSAPAAAPEAPPAEVKQISVKRPQVHFELSTKGA